MVLFLFIYFLHFSFYYLMPSLYQDAATKCITISEEVKPKTPINISITNNKYITNIIN